MQNTQKSGFPYLVDVKLTQFCPFGCSFCYQSSTKEGKHADTYSIYSLARTLQDAGVLEVNFGGGEPTLYKPTEYSLFSYAAKTFKDYKFRVGVTTKNYNWHKQKDFAEAIKYVDSVAVSINSLDEFEQSKDFASQYFENTWVYAQVIFGLLPWEEFKILIESIAKTSKNKKFHIPYYNNITFLGFKDFGFSAGSQGYEYPVEWIDWIKDLQKQYNFNLGVDSIMVKKWGKELTEYGVSPNLLVGREGSSSCYIDAVENKVYSSSFTNEKGVPISNDSNKFLEIFQSL